MQLPYSTSYLDNSQENDMLIPMSDSTRSESAIKEALAQNWKEAIRINQNILNDDPKDIDALNRLGYALLKTGKFTQAKQTFDKILNIDPYNRITLVNIKKIPSLKKHKSDHQCGSTVSPLLFLEDPGKTKIVDCVNAAPSAMLSTLTCGQELVLKSKKHGVDLRDTANRYVGALPDDMAYKIGKFMEAGNNYSAHVKRITKSCVSVFIREVKRGKRFRNQPSFSSSLNYMPSVKSSRKTTSSGKKEKNEEN